MLTGDISERTKLPWAHNTLFFICFYVLWYLSTSSCTCAHHQQFHTTIYIFSFVIMSSFLLKKSICGNFCFSVSIWRNQLPNRIECLWRPMATMLYWKQAEICFAGSMTTILTWETRSEKIDPGRLKTVNCRLFWTRTIPIAKNACRAIGCFSSSNFHAATCHREGSKDRKTAWIER